MIRIGIGGWTFEPWRGPFYPAGTKQAEELAYASRAVGTIEINGTYYRTQTPTSFRKWAAEAPEGFVFTVKGSQFVTNRKVLAEAGPSLEKFFGSGVTELGPKLGPILWQFAPTKVFVEEDFGAFLALLPREVDGVPIRHAVEVRHPSFATPAFVDLLRRHAVPVVYADHPKYPAIADLTGDFVYARLQRSHDDEPAGYAQAEHDAWAERCRTWAAGGDPEDLPHVAPTGKKAAARDVFLFFIGSAKVRNPAAAMALAGRLGAPAPAKKRSAASTKTAPAKTAPVKAGRGGRQSAKV